MACLGSALVVPERAAAQSQAFPSAAYGTTRQPASVAMEGLHIHSGSWSIMAHGDLTLSRRWEPGPRGEPDAFFTNMIGATARRALAGGWLEIAARASLEPAMGRSGYSLLLQTGESADGVVPLLDRQHPHEALMELSASYRVEIDEGAWAFLYVAPVGSPALGPVPYMHRPSGSPSPVAPISHHFLDATHVTHGVLTGGIFNERLQAEASWFTGREPDDDRWTPEAPRLDSWSVRLTVTPVRSLALQGSFGALHEPERLHPGVSIHRSTLSVAHHAMLGDGISSSTTVAWGRNTWPRTTVSVSASPAVLPQAGAPARAGAPHGFPGPGGSSIVIVEERSQSALLVESALEWRGATAFARWERVRKDELFPVDDARHAMRYRVGKLEGGLVGEVATAGGVRLGIGATVGVHWLPPELVAAYGASPTSYMLFTRIGF